MRALCAAMAAALLFAHTTFAQPTPGAAPGSQTGDGGGGYTGIASAPQANLFTGAAEAAIPIEAPPGRLGQSPALSLTYSSSSGPGPYGYGWTLPLPRIARSTKHGVPRYTDDDVFVLAMPGGVMELEPIPGSTRGFRPKVESTFPRIGFHRTQNLWKVIDKGGTVFTFGSTAQTRTGRGASTNETFSWLLERMEDPAGNRIDFSYRSDPASGLSSGLPDVIRYGANAGQGVAHFAEIVFRWSPRQAPSTPTVSFRSGFAEPMDVLLSSIETSTRNLPARRYDFSYDIDEVTAEARLVAATLTAFGETADGDVALPSTVFIYGDAVSRHWPTGGAGIAEGMAIPQVGRLRYGKRTVEIDTLDMNGDGIVDHVEVRGTAATVRLGTGTGFGPPLDWNWPATPQVVNPPTCLRRIDGSRNVDINVFDIDGDGFADLVDARHECGAPSGKWCVWRGSAAGFADSVFYWRAPGSDLRRTAKSGSRVLADLVDVDGDGRSDYVDSSSFTIGSPYWRVYRNEGDGFAATPASFRAPLPYLGRTEDGALLYSLLDMNADGLPDLLAAAGDEGYLIVEWENVDAWYVFYNTGNGLSPVPVPWTVEGEATLPRFLSMSDEHGTLADLVDITGDGRPDLVRQSLASDRERDGIRTGCSSISCYADSAPSIAVASGYCCHNMRVFVNTGSSFSDPIAWEYPSAAARGWIEECPFSSWIDCGRPWLYQYDLFDFNGDGLVDFVTQGGPGDEFDTWRVYFHPATPGRSGQGPGSTRTRPHLLVAMLNGIGGETLLQYAPASAAPDSVIPFPFWTVSARQLRDGIYDSPPLSTTISYRGGRYDAAERELRGFAMVWEVDAAGLTRVREFAQDRRLQGRLQRLSLLARPSCQAADPDDPTDPCSPWQAIVGSDEYYWSESGAVLLKGETRTPYVHGTAVEALRTTTRYEHDDYGNERQRTTETALAAATTVTTAYDYKVADKPGGMPDTYSVNKPARIVMTEDGRTEPLLEKEFDYDWRVPARGALVSASTCVSWNEGACSRWSTRRFSHDGFGNVVSAISATGQRTITTYDALGVFAVSAEEPGGTVTFSAHDPRTGKPTYTQTPNGNSLYSRYDGLGRLLATWGPGTSSADPLATNSYVPGAFDDGVPRLVARRKGTAPVATFYDGLGRQAGRKTLAEVDGSIVGVVGGVRKYDAYGQVSKEAIAFEVASTALDALRETIADAPAWMEHTYDAAGRRVQTTFPDGRRVRRDPTTPGILLSYDANILSGEGPGAVTIELFDGLNRRLQRDSCSRRPTAAKPYECPTGSLQRSEAWFYDGLGRVVESRVAALGQAAGDAVTRVSYSGVGDRVAVFNSNAGTWTFDHDDDRRLLAITTPDGNSIRSSYDASGRLHRREGRGVKAGYRYHTRGGGLGKVRRIITRTVSSRMRHDFDYDDRGRLTVERWAVYVSGDTTQRWRTEYGYDDLDRRHSINHPSARSGGGPVMTEYNSFGQPVAVHSPEQAYVVDAAYDAHGRLLRIDYGNGVSERFEYDRWDNAADTNGQLRCLRTTHTPSSGTACESSAGDLEALWYRQYDANGNLLAVEDLVHSPAERAYDQRSYRYDALGRLTQVAYGDGTTETTRFDPLDNLIRNGNSVLTFADAAKPNQLSKVAIAGSTLEVEHDANGYRKRLGDRSYHYDGLLRLNQVRDGGGVLASFGYEDTGARLYRYDGRSDSIRYEFGSVALEDGTLETSIFFGDRLVALRGAPHSATSPRAPTTLFLHSDHQGTPRLVTDGHGRVMERSRYSAFGRIRGRFDGEGRTVTEPATPYGFTGQQEEEAAGLTYFGARYYDASTGSFLTLDPQFQFTSPYAYSDGNPVLGRDADGRVYELTAVEIVALLVGTASFVDTLVSTGNLGQSLTAGVTAGVTVLVTSQLSTMIVKPAGAGTNVWLQQATAVATQGFQLEQAVQAIDDGRYASGIVAAGLTAASLIGIETANDPGPGTTDAERYARHGIVDHGVVNGVRTIDVSGICATRPGCVSNFFVALRENLTILLKGEGACVNGCSDVKSLAAGGLKDGQTVRLRCNSFGAIKCLKAIQDLRAAPTKYKLDEAAVGKLSAELTGAPILRPPVMESVAYHVNLFDPVTWVGTAYAVPFRSDVILGRSWWVPAPLLVHHDSMYHESLADLLRNDSQ